MDGSTGGDFRNEAGEDFSGANFYEVGVAEGDEVEDGLAPADGAGDLGGEGGADLAGGGYGGGGVVCDDGDGGGGEGGGGELGGEFFLGGCHEA